MAKERNLSRAEISIVKAMLWRGWRNDVIHFYFNKPFRLISSGRITQIKKGKYGASVEGPCRMGSRRSCRPGRIRRQRHARRLHPSTCAFSASQGQRRAAHQPARGAPNARHHVNCASDGATVPITVANTNAKTGKIAVASNSGLR
jgi:hypothetical protein